MKLIVGLGNPGRSHVNDRHNVGFRCVSYLARRHGIVLGQRKSKSRLGTGEIAGIGVVLARPQTFMNLSGEAVGLLVRRFGVPLEDLLVVYDDLDLPLGKVRIRARGSSGGHRGVESIVASLRSSDFPRIRVGIGRPEGDAVSYVLKGFSMRERETVDQVLDVVSDAIYCVLTEGMETAMNRYN